MASLDNRGMALHLDPVVDYRVKHDKRPQHRHARAPHRHQDRDHPLLRAHRSLACPCPHRGQITGSTPRAHLERLSFIRRGRDLGFSLDAVRALLRLADDRSQPCAEVDRIARLHLTEVEGATATGRMSGSCEKPPRSATTPRRWSRSSCARARIPSRGSAPASAFSGWRRATTRIGWMAPVHGRWRWAPAHTVRSRRS